MHIDLSVALAGLIVGFTVGLTGMGGGALMTPILVLLFKVQPLAAVSSDLVAAMVMKPVGGSVHAKRGTVNWTLVRWLALGSIPAAFGGVFVLRALGGDHFENKLKIILGVVLIVAATSITCANCDRSSPLALIPFGQCTIVPLRVPPQCDATCFVHW